VRGYETFSPSSGIVVSIGARRWRSRRNSSGV